jgi:hypothetical protein
MTPVTQRFLAQLVTVDPEQARAMRMAWDLEDPGPRRAAWAAATVAMRAAGREWELDDLREAVNTWAGDRAFNFVDLYGGGSPERTRQEARFAALPPVMDAGLALVAADLLDQDQRYALAKPFRAGMTGASRRRRAGAGPGGRRAPGR